ncbi:hypothetical protein Tco_1258075 [Tanacetum coccineum]
MDNSETQDSTSQLCFFNYVHDHVKKPKEPIQQRTNDSGHEEILGVMYDTNDDVSINGNEDQAIKDVLLQNSDLEEHVVDLVLYQEVVEEVIERVNDQAKAIVDPSVDLEVADLVLVPYVDHINGNEVDEAENFFVELDQAIKDVLLQNSDLEKHVVDLVLYQEVAEEVVERVNDQAKAIVDPSVDLEVANLVLILYVD